MANTLTNLQNTLISQVALEAFTAALTPLRAFSTNCSPKPGERGDKIKVLWTQAASAAAAFAGTYTMQDSTAEGLDVTIDQHYFVSWNLTDKELVDRPQLELERFGRQKGFQLAKVVLQNIWAQVTLANYGAAAFTGLSSTFDADDVVDLGVTCDNADWPDNDRGLILSPSYHGALRKDDAIQGADKYGSADSIRSGRIPSIDSFDALYKSSLVPANGENLVGFAVLPDSMLVAMRYLAPQPGHDYFDAHPLTDSESGMTLGYRQWYDNATGTMKIVLEALWGKRVGNTAALKRMVSA